MRDSRQYWRKYPRTPHLPFSPGASSDDVWMDMRAAFEEREVVITEKMDGENTTMYRDHIHARSMDSKHHPSRSWVKGLHHTIADRIPVGWRVCGENLFAKHSVGYDALPSYFMMFSIWDESDSCLSWEQTREWSELLDLELVPVLYEGVWDEEHVRALAEGLDTDVTEGFVVRLAGEFERDAFREAVAKWVRADHVQTEEHWMHRAVEPNGLADTDADTSHG